MGICKSKIRESSGVRPRSSDSKIISAEVSRCLEALESIYENSGHRWRVAPFAGNACRLIEPYLSEQQFLGVVMDIVDRVVWAPADDHVPLMDLLLEAHELVSQKPATEPRTPHTASTTLLDLLKLREGYRPITEEGSFFIFGARVDFGPSLESYREVAEVMQSRRVELELQKALLEVVLYAVEHLLGSG